MSVLIKGMEMPKNCLECTFYRKEDPIYDYCCISYATPQGYIPSDCPLVELPPHGRLIDADALFFTDFTLAQIALEKENPFKNLAIAIFEKIESAPTIIPAEEGE